MNLKLREEVREKLVDLVVQILGQTTVSSNSYLGTAPFYQLGSLEEELRRKTAFWTKCEKYISDRQLPSE